MMGSGSPEGAATTSSSVTLFETARQASPGPARVEWLLLTRKQLWACMSSVWGGLVSGMLPSM